jgi:hypothetical protein
MNLFIINQSLEDNEFDWDFLEAMIELIPLFEIDLLLYLGF